ncbi:hypothetical protein LCM4579_11195 [Ensifer sp. LCM 4579]|nr:hypothetical protein LCM4579_11195 [Ensifer sp. LCM 4579]
MALPASGMETDLVRKLERARSQIEQRFLDGGAVLLAVLDVLNKLGGNLEQLTMSLDESAARATASRLVETAEQLSALPSLEGGRQVQRASIEEREKSLDIHIAAMQETLRYLRTFAMTAKIAGAGIPDFAGFAEEIVERIQFGTAEVNQLSVRLTALRSTIAVAAARGSQTLERYQNNIPPIVKNLSRTIEDLNVERRQLAGLAEKVAQMTRKVQTKVATTLSAMQIGDITRQRIEHCQSAFTIADAYFASQEGRTLDGNARQRIALLVARLVFEQLAELTAHFGRDCATVVATIKDLSNDISSLMKLASGIAPEGDGESGIRRLETDIAAARGVVAGIEEMAEEAARLSRETTGTVAELLLGIETIRLVRTDIQYMALNTNLRCSKLGEDGRAINVVTAELRAFSALLDDTAAKILEALKGLEADAARLGEGDHGFGNDSLDGRLAEVLARIREAGDVMDANIASVQATGRDVASTVAAAVGTLDFKTELGDVLADCTEQARLAVGETPTLAGLEAAVAAIGDRIARVYTMNSEREIHGRIFGPGSSAAAAPTANSDDDLFEDALF